MRYVALPILLLISFLTLAQKSSSELYLDLKKLGSLKRVLYIAAHPDDENTRALAWLSLGEEASTAYLSLTRGDGGQNLIGNELGAELGILRSQELLAARGIDNAQQFFSRAVDFGYSRTADESFKMWQKEDVLSDVVRIIRQFKPDVIVTRFPPDERAGHGHHTASAMLAMEAFEKAAQADYEPAQVKQFGVWQVESVYWNASNWWNNDIDSIAQNNPEYLVFDIGAYNATLGKSYNEIGTLARSQHKCQGFGSVIERGERKEYFQRLLGTPLKKSFFENSKRTWASLGSATLDMQFQDLIKNYDFVDAQKNVITLLKIYSGLKQIQDDFIRQEKLELCRELITNLLGLHIELLAADYGYSVGETIPLDLELLNRSEMPISINSVTINGTAFIPKSSVLTHNQVLKNSFELKAPNKFYNPYWLESEYTTMFDVLDINNIGKPASESSINAIVQLKIGTELFEYTIKGEHKWSDPSFGERRRDIVITPQMALSLQESTLIAKTETSKKLKVLVHSFSDKLADKISFSAPSGWTVTPNSVSVSFDQKHQEKWIEVQITPSQNAVSGPLTIINSKGQALTQFKEIQYDHIPTQIYFGASSIALVKINAEVIPKKIGYIKGVDDKLPQAIEQLGCEVTLMEVAELSSFNLADFETIVVGIRAYNVHPELINSKELLMNYVSEGGNLIIQYNTASKDVKEMQLGPFPFTVSRDRVTEEDALATFIVPEHPLLNKPNKITTKDFDGWVQERGLYFAGDWDSHYQPILSWHDTNEEPTEGALIVADYGKGHYIYTGISFFRELPMGVEGAYRLFANLLSYGRE